MDATRLRRFRGIVGERGSGTGLSGGAVPVEGGIVVSLVRTNRILEIDLDNARGVVEPTAAAAGPVRAVIAPRRAGRTLPVVHIAELLDASIAGRGPASLGRR